MHTPIKGHNAVLGLYKFTINLSGETKPEKRHLKKYTKKPQLQCKLSASLRSPELALQVSVLSTPADSTGCHNALLGYTQEVCSHTRLASVWVEGCISLSSLLRLS